MWYQVSGIRSNPYIIKGKKLFLNRESYPDCPSSSVSREEPESEVASSRRNSPVSEISEQLPFLILDETIKIFQNSMQHDEIC